MSGHERERLSAYLDRELPPNERAAVEAHLAACPECAALLAELAAVDEAARSLPAEAPEGYFETFPARVRARLPAPKSTFLPRRVPVWTWAAAAALLLAVVTPLTLRQLRPAPGETPSARLMHQTAPAKPEPKAEARARPPEPLPAARPARPVPVPPVAATPVTEAAPRSKDQEGQSLFAPAPAAPPPADLGVAAESTMGDAESEGVSGGVPSGVSGGVASGVSGGVALEAAPNRPKGAPPPPRPTVTTEASSPALSAASAGRSAEPASGRENDDVFGRLEAVRPRSAAGWRRLHDQWNAVAGAETDPVRADEARVRAIVAAQQAWRAGGDEDDEAVFRREAGAYLRREDARQKPRVERLLAEP